MGYHNRKSDEELLIQFVDDQGFDQPHLVAAADRLKECIRVGLIDYGVPVDDETMEV